MRILIADDHAIIRRGLKQILLQEYPLCEVGEASNAESLVAKVNNEKWNVIICDLNMPGRSGLDALQQIRLIAPDLPVLIMSIYSEDQYALRVLKAGASGYLNKEFIHDELLKAIQTVLQGKKFITSTVAEILIDSFNSSPGEPHDLLSNREFDVFKLLASGKSISEIAEQLSLSATTVSTYRSRIMEKMKMRSNSDLTKYAFERKLL